MFENKKNYIKNILENNSIQTPSLIYIEEAIDAPLNLMKDFLVGTKIHFALKSCYNSDVLKHLSDQGCGVEVMSELEYLLAEKNGFKPPNIIVNGIGRSAEFLENAINKNSTVIIDSENDLKKIQSIQKRADVKIRLGIRLKIDISEFEGSPYKHKDNKLGVFPNSKLFKEFIQLVNNENCVFELIHCHFTINELSPNIYISVLKKIKLFLSELNDNHPGITPNIINIGGGFEVYQTEKENEFKKLFTSINSHFKENFTGYSLAVEPGRYLVNYAGLVKTKVLDKKIFDNKTWLYVDAAANMLIPNSNARYCLVYPTGGANAIENISIGDGITSPSHVYLDEFKLDKVPDINDLIILGNCGAYTDVYSCFWGRDIYEVFFMKKNGQILCNRNKEKIAQLRKLFLEI